MPLVMVTSSIQSDAGANQPWPDNVKLYQPIESKQILLPDNANCLAVRAFLNMCNLKYEVVERINAEDMSPSGRVPFIKCGEFLVSDLEPLINFVASKGISLTGALDTLQKADMRAYMSLINVVLAYAENYILFCDADTFDQVTRKRYRAVHPWPLGWLLPRLKQKKVCRRLHAFGWWYKTMEEVYEEVDTCCNALSHRLDNNKYFFDDKPTELDAMLFAHVYSILTTPLPSNQLAATVRCYPKLVEHCQRVEKEYFSGPNTIRI